MVANVSRKGMYMYATTNLKQVKISCYSEIQDIPAINHLVQVPVLVH